MRLSPNRSALLCYNTVERMLKGDFFHTVTWDSVAADISPCPPHWPIVGIGTTNWFRRNGETIVGGTVAEPRLLWADPEGAKPMEILDLLREKLPTTGTALVTPSLTDVGESPPMPFLAVGVCDPAHARVWECRDVASIHPWIQERMAAENIGLAGVHIEAGAIDVTAAAAFYLPLEGLDLSHGYDASNNLKLADYSGGSWEVSGVYAANPTLQRMISVEGLPLHLHGFCAHRKQGGHVVRMSVHHARVTIWPLQDLVMQIKNLDQTWLPVRDVGQKLI